MFKPLLCMFLFFNERIFLTSPGCLKSATIYDGITCFSQQTSGFHNWWLFFLFILSYRKVNIFLCFNYSQFYKTLPQSSLRIHGLSVRFYEMGDRRVFIIGGYFFLFILLYRKVNIFLCFNYSPFHKTLPKSSLELRTGSR